MALRCPASRISANVSSPGHYAQILKLLRANGLKQYESSFLREEVTGELLLECDEHLLQNELGVTSKLHRLRLLRIISGKRII